MGALNKFVCITLHCTTRVFRDVVEGGQRGKKGGRCKFVDQPKQTVLHEALLPPVCPLYVSSLVEKTPRTKPLQNCLVVCFKLGREAQSDLAKLWVVCFRLGGEKD